MRRPFFLLLFALLSFSLAAQKLRFTGMDTIVSDSEKVLIGKIAAYELEFYKSVFGTKKELLIQVNVYGNFGRFMLTQRSAPRCGRSSQGYFDPRKKTVSVYKDSDFVHTCYHEISHAIFYYFCPKQPTWLTEGLACYFQFSRVDSLGTIIIEEPPVVHSNIYTVLAYELCPPDKLVSHSYRRFHRFHKRELCHYTLSWGIVDFLMRTRQESLKTIMKNICSGQASLVAIKNEYPGGIERLRKDMLKFYRPEPVIITTQ